MTKAVITGFFCFLLFVGLHIFIFHNFHIRRRFFTMAKLFSGFALLYVAAYLIISEEDIALALGPAIPLLGFLNGAFLHYFFFHFYLNFIQIVDRSTCTRILVEIESSPRHRLNPEELKQRYSMDDKIFYELHDMVTMGRLEKRGDFYANTLKGRWHYRLFKFIRDFLRLEKN